MGNRLLLLIAIIFLGTLSAKAEEPYNQYWSKANRFYKQKAYDSSIYYYEKIAALKPANPELYYNLGNAYYRSNEVAESVLNYKRALKLRPGYALAEDNLLLAQNRTAIKTPYSKDVFFIAWWKRLTGSGSAQAWAVAALLVFLALISLFFWFQWKKMQGQMQRSLLFSGTAIFFFMIIAAYVSADRQDSEDEAVVMTPDALFKKDTKSAKSEMLPEGTVVTCSEGHGAWTPVILPDGREGWVRTESIEKI